MLFLLKPTEAGGQHSKWDKQCWWLSLLNSELRLEESWTQSRIYEEVPGTPSAGHAVHTHILQVLRHPTRPWCSCSAVAVAGSLPQAALHQRQLGISAWRTCLIRIDLYNLYISIHLISSHHIFTARRETEATEHCGFSGLSFANGVIMLKTLSADRFEVLERSSFDEAPSSMECSCDFGFAGGQDCIY